MLILDGLFWGASWWPLGNSQTRRVVGTCLRAGGGIWRATWGRLGASWGPLGGLLRASWGPLGPSQGPPRGFVGPRARDFVSCSPSGPLLGPSWAPLGPSWMPLGQSWSPLGPSWGPLGSLLGPLGAILEASWAVLGRREAEKVETPKSAQYLKKNNEFCLLGPSWECSWRPLGASGGHLGRLGAFLWHLGPLV